MKEQQVPTQEVVEVVDRFPYGHSPYDQPPFAQMIHDLTQRFTATTPKPEEVLQLQDHIQYLLGSLAGVASVWTEEELLEFSKTGVTEFNTDVGLDARQRLIVIYRQKGEKLALEKTRAKNMIMTIAKEVSSHPKALLYLKTQIPTYYDEHGEKSEFYLPGAKHPREAPPESFPSYLDWLSGQLRSDEAAKYFGIEQVLPDEYRPRDDQVLLPYAQLGSATNPPATPGVTGIRRKYIKHLPCA